MKEFLELNGFKLIQCADGKFWIHDMRDQVFLQVGEEDELGTFYDNGWVEDDLTVEEMQRIIKNGTMS